MISTTQVPNGFRSELLPMALSARDQASMSLFNAMLAVSAYHHFGSQAALPYKVNAVRSLLESLRIGGAPLGNGLYNSDRNQTDMIDTQIAASMMLCVYSVSWKLTLFWCSDSFVDIITRFLMRQKGTGTCILMARGLCFNDSPLVTVRGLNPASC